MRSFDDNDFFDRFDKGADDIERLALRTAKISALFVVIWSLVLLGAVSAGLVALFMWVF